MKPEGIVTTDGSAETDAGQALIEFADDARCARVSATLSLLANPRRLKLLCLLSECDRSVEELVQASGSALSATSQQLKLLSLSHILERRREGKHVFYHFHDSKMLEILHLLKNLYP
jgi:ArsR family transcriptional regulator